MEGSSPLVLGAEGREVEMREDIQRELSDDKELLYEEGEEDGRDVRRGTDEDEDERTICGVDENILLVGSVDVGRGGE